MIKKSRKFLCDNCGIKHPTELLKTTWICGGKTKRSC